LKLTQEQLAVAAGISQQSLQKIEDGKTKNPRKILELSKALECSPEWLMNGGVLMNENANISLQSLTLMAPLITWVQAGAFCETGQLSPIDDVSNFYPYPAKNAGKNTFALKVKGDSMTSTSGQRSYPEGSIIFVDPDKVASPGQRVIARYGNTTTFKQLMEDESGYRYLKPLNDRHELIKPNDDMHVCGVIIGAFMPE